jgi:hypothetical protein
MPNGKVGDHPLTDILIHGRRVYSERADDLVRTIVELGGKDRIADLLFRDFNEFSDPDVPRLEQVLSDIHDQLAADARNRGWEPKE